MPGDIFEPYKKNEKLTSVEVKKVGKNVEEFAEKNKDLDKKKLFELVKEQTAWVRMDVINTVNKYQLEAQNIWKNIEITSILKSKFKVDSLSPVDAVVKALKTIAASRGEKNSAYKDLDALCKNCTGNYDKTFFDAIMEYQLLGVTYEWKAKVKEYGVDGIAGPITLDSIIADLRVISPEKVKEGENAIEQNDNKKKTSELLEKIYSLDPKIIEANKDLLDEIATTDKPTADQIKKWEEKIKELSETKVEETKQDTESKEEVSEEMDLGKRIREAQSRLDVKHAGQQEHAVVGEGFIDKLKLYKTQLDEQKISKEEFDLLIKQFDEEKVNPYVDRADSYRTLNLFRKNPNVKLLPEGYVSERGSEKNDETPFIKDTPEVEKNPDGTYSVFYEIKADALSKYPARPQDPQYIVDKSGKVLVDLRYFYSDNYGKNNDLIREKDNKLTMAVDSEKHIFFKNGKEIDQKQAFFELSHYDIVNNKFHIDKKAVADFSKKQLSDLPEKWLYLFEEDQNRSNKSKVVLYDMKAGKYYYETDQIKSVIERSLAQ